MRIRSRRMASTILDYGIARGDTWLADEGKTIVKACNGLQRRTHTITLVLDVHRDGWSFPSFQMFSFSFWARRTVT
jgi:hypothetical protein